MNVDKRNEELLREASAYGDEEGVRALINSGVDINAQHSVNGWTALHWAAKRGHTSLVQYLLSHGADAAVTSYYGESPVSVAKTEDIRIILSGHAHTSSLVQNNSSLPITPNYLSNPPLAEKIDMDYQNNEIPNYIRNISEKNIRQNSEEELVLKVRSSDPPNQDFIEIEIPFKSLSYENVFKICCEELEILPQNVLKLRKLPNTVVRKDKDVLRFQNFQELELVLNTENSSKTHLTDLVVQTEVNGYNTNGNQQVANSVLARKSNYCKNGTLLY